ncbi:hypothetical protein [Mucilaginibacter sp. UYCu711]|uniref:hypothetical protein n=1 Tax=Mucilaginibacter sp. UYCu711 TaxID=3156339 RepID=UPI003D1B6620
MLEKSFELLFFLKQSKNEGKKFIYPRITVDCKAVEWSTREQLDSNRWDQDKCRAIGCKDDVKQINFFLDTLHSKVLKARQQLISEEEEITAVTARPRYRQDNAKNDTGNFCPAQFANEGTRGARFRERHAGSI